LNHGNPAVAGRKGQALSHQAEKHAQAAFFRAAYDKVHDRESIAERLIRRPEVEARTGLSRSTIYDWMKRGEFPQPVKLGARLVAWRESDVTEWLESRDTRVA
jgi:prophage regulatory protein